MNYEVELKFPLPLFESVVATLRQLSAVESSTVSHVDRYFNHPTKNFRTTDEALRIRSVENSNFVTYKGAKIGTVAKTRHEIEVGLADGPQAAAEMNEILTLLGFRFVREVRKTRQTYLLQRQGRDFELALDEVPGLGQFLEIELIVDDHDRQAAEAAIWELAGVLGLSEAEPRSYLDLLLRADDRSR